MRRQTGFTLVEQLTVLTVLSVLLAVSAPQLGPQLERQRLRAASSELLHALRFARANATLAGRPVVLCPSEDGESCTTRSDWSGGWIVYADGNRNQGFDAGEEMLLVHRLTGRGPSVRTSDGRRRIVYRDSGTSGGSNVRFVLCGGDRGMQIIVANSGRVRVIDAVAEGDCGV
jgi:type IV fimbrial biogenesis protein FimT